MNAKKFILLFAAALIAALILPTTAFAGEKGQDMYRLYNLYSGEHFYTASAQERDTIRNAGWIYEGVGWVAPEKSETPVYRLYNKYAGDHHYTTNPDEVATLVKAGWTDEGIGWYSDDKKTVALYRQYNPFAWSGTHNYTTSKDENDSLVKAGWNAEGIGWYGVGEGTPVDINTALANAQGQEYWNALLAKYRADASVQQLLLVKYLGGSNATSQFLVKDFGEVCGWRLVLQDDSYVGEAGAGTASSSASITPMGDFAVTEAFGIKDDPGTALPYILATSTVCGSCDCSTNCPYFNTIHDVAENGHWECNGERLIDYAPDYNYGLNFNYNPEKIYEAGSAFFVHCKGKDPFTFGCIALDEWNMVEILKQATPGMRVITHQA